MFILLLPACRSEAPRPVEIESGDMCSLCKMAISQKPFAAEIVDKEENVHKFDDIGCMLRFVSERGMKDRVKAYFVMDYDGKGWLAAESAYYVRSEALHTPMGGGLLAVKDRSRAEDYLRKFSGQVLVFGDLVR